MSFLRHASGQGPEDLARIARRAGVKDERVLEAIASVPREVFVPAGSERAAYADRPVPIPHGQTTSQPSLIAMMIEALELTGDERVLEIGTGYGYQTALLAALAAQVWSVERFPELADAASANLQRAGLPNAHVVAGDGREGLPDEAPFDAMILSAATSDIPGPLVDQLAEHGRLVAPIGPGGAEEVIVYRRGHGGLERVRALTRARFVPLLPGRAS